MSEIKRYGASLAAEYRKNVVVPPVPTSPIKSVDSPKIVVPSDKEKKEQTPATPTVKETKEVKKDEKQARS